MDLSPARFDRAAEFGASPGGLAVLMVGVAARAAASPTAACQTALERAGPRSTMTPSLLAPAHGCFSAAAARSLGEWRKR